MAKGYQAHKERQDEISTFGKAIAKRAAFSCEWCEGKEELRVWEYQPGMQPDMDNLAMLCRQCRELADGKKASSDELRSIRNALWSSIPAVSQGAAQVLSQCNESWVKDAVEQSCIDDRFKELLLAKTHLWK